MKHNNVMIYFKTSCVCMLVYWSIIIITLAVKSSIDAVCFGLLSALLYSAALILGFKRGNVQLVPVRMEEAVEKMYRHVIAETVIHEEQEDAGTYN